MKYYILFVVSIISVTNCVAQTNDERLKTFGQQAFERFVRHDFDWILERVEDKKNAQRFRNQLEEVFFQRTHLDKNYPWQLLIVDHVTVTHGIHGSYTRVNVYFNLDGNRYNWNLLNVYYHEKEKVCRITTPHLRIN